MYTIELLYHHYYTDDQIAVIIMIAKWLKSCLISVSAMPCTSLQNVNEEWSQSIMPLLQTTGVYWAHPVTTAFSEQYMRKVS